MPLAGGSISVGLILDALLLAWEGRQEGHGGSRTGGDHGCLTSQTRSPRTGCSGSKLSAAPPEGPPRPPPPRRCVARREGLGRAGGEPASCIEGTEAHSWSYRLGPPGKGGVGLGVQGAQFPTPLPSWVLGGFMERQHLQGPLRVGHRAVTVLMGCLLCLFLPHQRLLRADRGGRTARVGGCRQRGTQRGHLGGDGL